MSSEPSPVWTLRVTAVDRFAARAAVRRRQFTISRPLDFDPAHDGITALEYALGALAGEVVGALRVFADRRRIALEAVEAVVSGELRNPLTYLEVVGAEGDPGLARVQVKVYASSPGGEAALRRLWDEMLERLPLVSTFRRAGGVELHLTITP
ncbi:MAG TPA: hypothetical protein VNN07_08605 [Candidatus Tectomicrobia bacterium]|nr:hypothetical protein [Candidatus Tectomicrobia bacterium]